MKWQSHKVVTFFTTLSLTGNPVFAVLSLPGSIFPDVFESLGLKHRTYSHLTGVWLLITLSLLLFVSHTQPYGYLSYFTIKNFFEQGYEGLLLRTDLLNNSKDVLAGILIFSMWFSFGAFMHCVEDMLTGGIPIFNPHRKFRKFKLFRTGSVKEYIFCCFYIVACVALIYFFQIK